MEMWAIWLIISGLFFIGEIITVGFLLFWFGFGALIAMVVSLFTSNIIIQTIVFLITSVILLLITKPFVKKFINKEPSITTNAYNIVGKKAIVIEEIDNIQNKGLIRVGSEVWSAQSETDEKVAKDTEVTITDIKGVKAIVKV